MTSTDIEPGSDAADQKAAPQQKKRSFLTNLKRWWVSSRKTHVLSYGSSRHVESFIDTAKRWRMELLITPADLADCLIGEYEAFIERPVITKKDRQARKRVADRISASNLVIKVKARFNEKVRSAVADIVLSGQPGSIAIELLEDMAAWGYEPSEAGLRGLIRHLTFHYSQNIQARTNRIKRREDRSKAEKSVPTNPDMPTLQSWVRTHCNKPLLLWLYAANNLLAEARGEPPSRKIAS